MLLDNTFPLSKKEKGNLTVPYRFLDIEGGGLGTRTDQTGREESSESETENAGEEAVTSEKFLLLIDQLSVDQKRHLTIKDIGIILERLSSKILDVERLDRYPLSVLFQLSLRCLQG